MRHMRMVLLGLPGAGKRTLLAELATLPGADTAPSSNGAVSIPLAGGLAADLASATYDHAAPSALADAARHGEALLLAQDLADASLGQVATLRAALAAHGFYAVPQPLPVVIRPRGKGGLSIDGGDDVAVRDALLRWCRARQIAHAQVTVRFPIALGDLPLYAAAAWHRSGGARARPSPMREDLTGATFRPTLVVGTRYDEYEAGAPDAATAEERLRAAAPWFGCVAVSVFDPDSLERLRGALAALLAG